PHLYFSRPDSGIGLLCESALLDDRLCDLIDTFATLKIRKNEGPFGAHSQRITPSVHAIKVSVVRDQISRSVSYSIQKLVQRESVRLPERQQECCSGCREDRIVEWRLNAKTCDHAYSK